MLGAMVLRCDGDADAVVAYAIDVGSTRKSKGATHGAFAWARATRDRGAPSVTATGTTFADLIVAMTRDADAGAVTTLGIEAPLWLPIPEDAARLSEGRAIEGSRSCFAPAGGYVAMLGLHQLAHLMRRLPACWRLSLDWTAWDPRDATTLLLWEAFVSGAAHARRDDPSAHARDAATAAAEFMRRGGALKSDVKPDGRATLSLAGTAMLWAERSTDISLLKMPTLVLRPKSAWFLGAIA